ncbi:v-type proton ATPase subunit c [Phtheirospermum japonicum]|uniref:V-type proton ATPase subunit C n=1 Tax=Phtheirospermum japonicum TaxID=374723 RepID=A0A830C1K0_9LAMI|nr:v-type proton ATPase subunit c [Phtheirospermum japonicum]
MSPLRETVDGINVQIARIEDDLKVRVAEYNNVRSQLNAINRKQAGSQKYITSTVKRAGPGHRKLPKTDWSGLGPFLLGLTNPLSAARERRPAGQTVWPVDRTQADGGSKQEDERMKETADVLAVRDLSNLVKPQDIVSSEHLTTLIAIVSKYSQKDWLSSYETLTPYVVPRSSKKLHEDNEYALYTVTLFIHDADNFRTKARERNFQIRDFEYNPETQESRKQELEKLVQDQETLRSSLLQWCYTSYGELSPSFGVLELELNFYKSSVEPENKSSCSSLATTIELDIRLKLGQQRARAEHWRSCSRRLGSFTAPSKPSSTALLLKKGARARAWLLLSSSTRELDFEFISRVEFEFDRLKLGQQRARAEHWRSCSRRLGSFTAVFSSWMHFCAVRVFSESILRYGLPPSFLSVVLSPPAKSEKKVRSILEGLCISSNSTYWKTEDEGGMGGFAGDADAHPYVSIHY